MEIKERPILFSGPMVRAILAGDKTQTRRVVTAHNSEGGSFPVKKLDVNKATYQPPCFDSIPYLKAPVHPDFYDGWMDETWHRIYSRIRPGDRLWVRETWALTASMDIFPPNNIVPTHKNMRWFKAGKHTCSRPDNMLGKWRPSIFMPRWASRILLEVVDVRVERVQEISAIYAWYEGVRCGCTKPVPQCAGNIEAFKTLWDTINTARGFGWDVNPWVWVVEFKVLEVNS